MATECGYHIELVTPNQKPQGFSIWVSPTDTVENIYIKVTDKLKSSGKECQSECIQENIQLKLRSFGKLTNTDMTKTLSELGIPDGGHLICEYNLIKRDPSPFNLDMIVEIPFNSSVKYEYDEKLDKMRCDRLLTTSMLYPGNYGYIPRTLSGDGDPLDILLVCDYAIYPGTVVNVKVIGVLLTTDEKGKDEKIIAVPSNSVDISFKDINTLDDLGAMIKKRIYHFFEHYKDIDDNKWVKIDDFKDVSVAKLIVHQSRNLLLNKEVNNWSNEEVNYWSNLNRRLCDN